MTVTAEQRDEGKRLDAFLHERLPEFSRSRLQAWIKEGRVLVGGMPGRASQLIRCPAVVSVEPGQPPPLRAEAEDLPLEILYEDDDVVAVNKAAGVVVHAGAGHSRGTLVNALLHHFGKLSSINGDLRPGIVHRLDRDTSGVLLVARTDKAHRMLARQFHDREVEKHYLALVSGHLREKEGRITSPITRDPVRRTRMTAKLGTGRTALTDYRVLEELAGASYLSVRIGTGRTHQIRVHLSSIGHPVVGDRLYGAPVSTLGRVFLHAERIAFVSPGSGKRVEIISPLARDLADYLKGLGPYSS